MSMEAVVSFLDSEVPQATLGLVYGRRRIGKSTLLSRVASDRGGFYWEATRTASAVHLARLGGAIGAHLGTGPLQLDDWDDAVRALLRLGSSPIPVVIDEFGHVLEADPSVASVIASALGPDARQSNDSQARLILVRLRHRHDAVLDQWPGAVARTSRIGTADARRRSSSGTPVA